MQFLAALTFLATATVAVALPGINMAQASCQSVRFATIPNTYIFGGFTTNGCYRARKPAPTSPSPTPTAAPAVLLSSAMKPA